MDTHNLSADIKIFCLKAEKFPEGVSAAFDKLVKKVGATDQRIFYGISYMEKDGSITYKAGATELAEGEGAKHGLEYFTIPSGKYITETIRDWKKNIEAIAPTFQKLMRDSRFDKVTPCVEWQKSNTELVCMVKMK